MREDSENLERILLIGNPNAGKSTLFNALTGAHAKVGNWHGVTVGVFERQTVLNGKRCLVCDLPGIYSLDGMSLEEKLACEYIDKFQDATLFFVAECAQLLRALPMFSALLKRGNRAALIVTKRKQFERAGGKINLHTLESVLGIPVISAESPKKALKTRCGGARAGKRDVGAIPPDAYLAACGGLKKADRVLLNGMFGIPIFFLSLLIAFFCTFAPNSPGDFLKNTVDIFFSGFLYQFASQIPSEILRAFVADGLLVSVGSVLCFLPQIAMLFLFLILMEESGFLSRLAILTDGFFCKIGLNGRAVFSLLMGFGCTAAAILTTRGLDDKRIQRRVILALPYISCSAKLPVFLTLSASFFSNPFVAVLLLYAIGVGISVLVSVFLKGKAQPFVMELAPLQIPDFIFVVKSLCFQIKQFIIKVATVILAFFIASWLLSSFNFSFEFCSAEESMLAIICGWIKFLFAPIGCGDWQIAYAALSGLIAKENVAGALALFYGGFPYSAQSAFAFCIFILACSPCVSAIAATARELGIKRAVLYAVGQTVGALLLSYLVYFLLYFGAAALPLLIIFVLAILIFRKKPYEKIRRSRTNHPRKVHR